MFTLMRHHKDLSLLLTSIFVSMLGTWFTYMLFIVQMYDKTQDSRQTMVIVGAEAVAGIIGGQIAGMLIENKKPKFVLMATNLISAIIIAAVVFVPTEVKVYACFAFLIAFISAFSYPALQKYLVAVVHEDELMAANSSMQTVNEIVKIAGPALAVTVLAVLPADLKHLGFVIDAISYLFAFVLLLGLKNVMKLDAEADQKQEGDWLNKWKGGLTPLKDPIVLNVFAVFLFLLFGIAGADVVLTAHVSEAGLNTYSVGYIIGALSLGLLLTASFAAPVVKRLPLSVQLGCSALLLGVSYSLIGFGHHLLSMMGAAFVLGIFNAVYNMSSSTFWQKRVPYKQLGRFFSFANSIFSLATLIGMVANAFISQRFSAGFDLILCGLIITITGTLLIITITLTQKKAIASGQSKKIEG
ncbi:MFS transporter [Camelliibacillus cellulosilyticus]|uniref:MFS transporter n=1 Tax=Camelliibacillus cellulosilyticus TaxID=2174486 RepID=A0ABV9GQH3_9BACL